MTDGYIDSASTYEVVVLLSYRQPSEAYGWAWQGAITTSSALINCSHFRMAPAPDLSTTASGPYGKLMLALSELITHTRPDQQLQGQALHKARRWANANADKVRSAYRDMKADQGFPKWLDWVVNHSWKEHSSRLGGLFDVAFIPQIARILDVPGDYLSDVHRLSRDLDILNHYAKHEPMDKDDFRVMADAFAVSILLRGRYHDYVARGSSLQIIHHPYRQPVLPKLRGSQSEFVVSNTERYLSNIILASAFAERKHEERILCWADNILKTRKATLAGSIDLRPKNHDEVALDLAVRAAKQLGVRVYPKWLETVLDAAAALGFGILTTFVLSGWEGLLVTPIEFAVSRRLNIGKAGARLLYSTGRRLRDLARSEPGRVEQKWRAEREIPVRN